MRGNGWGRSSAIVVVAAAFATAAPSFAGRAGAAILYQSPGLGNCQKHPGIPARSMKELFEAVRAGDLARVQTLVEADPTLAIFAASILGDLPRLEELLTGNRSLVSGISSDGWTPLHLAAFFGKEDAVRLLLNKGASVKARSTNPMTNTPLHAAAAGKHAEIAGDQIRAVSKAPLGTQAWCAVRT